ncbi:hypothetical protein BX666DRAFT_2122981 [Dichotomocladium elegans]|nr:hypothetical protein BX666DRAFT_2122981 [Dichotomocladium elegans]
MKPKKNKASNRQPATDEQQHHHSHGGGNALTFLKNRLFYSSSGSNQPPLHQYSSHEESSSASKSSTETLSSSSPFRLSAQSLPITRQSSPSTDTVVKDRSSSRDRHLSRSFEEPPVFDKTSSGYSGRALSGNRTQSSSRPFSVMGLLAQNGDDDGGNNPNGIGGNSALSMRRHPADVKSVGTSDGATAERATITKRTSLVVIKEGLLYKKADFRAFHKASKLDRSWRLYRVVLRGHKLYLYKLSSESSSLRSLFPSSSSLSSSVTATATSVTSLPYGQNSYGLVSSRSSSSIASSAYQIKSAGDVIDDPSEVFGAEYSNKNDCGGLGSDQYICGAVFKEIIDRNQSDQQQQPLVCLLLYANELVLGACSLRQKPLGWQVETRVQLDKLKVERQIQVDNTFALVFNEQLRIFSSPVEDVLLTWLDNLQNAMDRVESQKQSTIHQGPMKHPNLIVEADNYGNNSITGGTVGALVHELLFRTQSIHDDNDNSDGDEYLRTFLLTYTMFATSSCVFDAIKAYALTNHDAKLSMRILDIFTVWCEQFAQDVVGDVVDGMMATLDVLGSFQVDNDDDNSSTSLILRQHIKKTKDLVLVTVNKNGEAGEQANESAMTPAMGENVTENIPSSMNSNSTKSEDTQPHVSTMVNLSNLLITGLTPSLFLSIDPERFAEQIYVFHLMQHRLHKDALQSPLSYIPRPHISAQIINSVAFTTNSPHFLTKLLRHQILIDSQHQAEANLGAEDQASVAAPNSTLMRTQLLEHWIRVGIALFDWGDMTGWCAIAAGICTLGVTRLKESWKSVPRPLVEIVIQDWVSLLVDHGFFSQDIWVAGWEQESVVDKFAEILTMKAVRPTDSCNQGLAFFGTLRQSVDRLRKHIKDNYPDGNTNVVNFEKYRSIYRAIQSSLAKWHTQCSQSTVSSHPEFQIVKPLQAFFDHSVTSFISVPHDFKYLNESSLACEPRIFGQSFGRHRKFNSLQGNNVAPPSSLTLTFPEVLEGYRLFPTDSQLQQSLGHDGAPTPLRGQVRKKSSSQSMRSVQGEQTSQSLADTTRSSLIRDKHELHERTPPRVTSRKMFRRRTHSFPPGGSVTRDAGIGLRGEDGHYLGGGGYQASYLESLNSRTWLGSLVSQKESTHASKALVEVLQRREKDNNGEWLIIVEQGGLVFKASTLLQSDDSITKVPVKKSTSSGFMVLAEKGSSGIRSRSGTINSINEVVRNDEDALNDYTPTTAAVTDGRCVLVNVKAGQLQYLVDTLVHGVSHYSKDMREQWQLPSLLNGRLEEVPQYLTIDEEEFTSAFFVTYRSFCSCVQLLDLLSKKFTGAMAASASQLARQRKRNTLETVFSTNSNENDYNWRDVAFTQLKIVNLMLYWVEEHFYDFVDEAEILNHFSHFLEQVQAALDEWSTPLRQVEVPTSDTCQALSVARVIYRQIQELRRQFVQKIMSPSYDLKAINYDTTCSRKIEELYTQLTLGSHSYSVGIIQGSRKSPAFSLTTRPLQMLGTASIVDQQSAFTLLGQVDRCVRQLFASVTFQDWIQTFDVFEAESSDLYSWLPAHKASQTPPMSSTLSPVREGPSAQPTSYHLSPDDVMISDIFTAIEGARRSVVSPSAFSADDLQLAFPSSIQYMYCMHFIIRSWVIHEICARSIDLDRRIMRIRKFLQMVLISKAVTGRMMLFPELRDVEDRPRRVPGFVEYAIASALISPEVRLFTRAWAQVSKSYGLTHIDTLENLLTHAQRKTAINTTSMTALVPSVGWVFDRMLELCAVVPDDYNQQPHMINFDKRRYIFHFLQLVMNAQMDLEEQPSQESDVDPGFVIFPNLTKPMWKELKDWASRENKGPTSTLGVVGGRAHYVREQPVFSTLVSEQLDKLKRDIKERDRIDKEWRDIQHKMQKRQLEQARYLEKQERKNQQQQHHHLLKLNTLFRGRHQHQQRGLSTQQEEDQLYAFETAKASTVINLIHATTSVASVYTRRDHVFRIVTEEGGQFLFQGMSRDDMHDWMQQINNAAREGAVKRRSVLAAESSEGATSRLVGLGSDEEQREYPQNARKSVYGMELGVLMHDGSVPLIASKCIAEIEKRGLDEVGIYRMAGSGSAVEKLKAAFNRDMAGVDLGDPMWADINVVADAFKQFLRSIPGSLLTHTYYDEFIHASASEDHDQRVYLIKQVLKKLPFANYALLKRLIGHFVIVTDFEAINHMYATNLAIVFGPTLLQPAPGPASFATTMSNLGHHQTIVKYLILHYHYLFDIEGDQQEDESALSGITAAVADSTPSIAPQGDDIKTRATEADNQ